MPPYADGENNFSDDDLDDLPFNALAELEYNAIQSTQAAYANSQSLAQPTAQPSRTVAPSSDYGDEFDDEDLDDAVVVDESRSTPASIPSLVQHVPRPPRPQYAPISQHRPSQFGNNASLNNRSGPGMPPFQPAIRADSLPVAQRGVLPRFSQGSQPLPAIGNTAELLRQLEEAILPQSLFPFNFANGQLVATEEQTTRAEP